MNSIGDIHVALAVRADKMRAVRARDGGELALRLLALLACFGEPGGQHDGERRAALADLPHRIRNAPRGNRDHHDVRGFRKRAQIGVAPAARDLLVAWIDRKDLPRIALCLEMGDRLSADRGQILRGAEDRDGARIEQAIEVFHAMDSIPVRSGSRPLALSTADAALELKL